MSSASSGNSSPPVAHPSPDAARRAAIVALDKAHVWHPYTPMDDYVAAVDPLVIARAQGAYLEDVDGRRYLDGNSSWWTATLGHGHPRLLAALEAQARELAHCSLGGIAHAPAAELARDLVAVAPPGLNHVFYTDNGSSSIEAAAKMAVQCWRQRGKPEKTRFLALDSAFHGESIGAASLCGVEVFRRPFGSLLFDCIHAPFPEAGAMDRAFEALAHEVRVHAGTLAAVVVEPLVQGAGGMRMYDARYLREISALCRTHDVLLIADEVFAGYGRTGRMWGCDHAGITPDLMCLGKAFAALIPMGAVLATDAVFDAFRGPRSHAFLYGHTYCGNPLGAALAREVLAIYRDERVVERAARGGERIGAAFERIARIPGVARVRTLGMIGAADLEPDTAVPAKPTDARAAATYDEIDAVDVEGKGYLAEAGWRVYEEARARGAYLRPLGSTVYVCPPLLIDDADLDRLLAILEESIRAALA